MRNVIAEIMENRALTADMYEMILRIPEGTGQMRPGQFIGLKLEGLYLRRPVSVCSWDAEHVTILYRTVGAGTGQMSRMTPGEKVDILMPLGNGYDMETIRRQAGVHPVLIGGGAGIPPMYGLCRSMLAEGLAPAVILGCRSKEDLFYEEQFEDLGAQVLVTTEDGSTGIRGFVTDALAQIPCSSVFACGPEPMLRAVDQALDPEIPGWFSFEERMGCGFGACMGCSCETKYGSKRICKDGPVLERSEIVW